MIGVVVCLLTAPLAQLLFSMQIDGGMTCCDSITRQLTVNLPIFFFCCFFTVFICLFVSFLATTSWWMKIYIKHYWSQETVNNSPTKTHLCNETAAVEALNRFSFEFDLLLQTCRYSLDFTYLLSHCAPSKSSTSSSSSSLFAIIWLDNKARSALTVAQQSAIKSKT